MAGRAREAHKARIVRARIVELDKAGYSVARIAMDTGKSHRHVANIVKQERPFYVPCPRCKGEGGWLGAHLGYVPCTECDGARWL